MEISKNHLKRAVEQNILSSSQADNLFDFLQAEVQHKPAFSFTHILYYLGGMIAIGAMTLFMNMGWETFGGAGIVFIALLYACAGLTLTRSFDKRQLLIPMRYLCNVCGLPYTACRVRFSAVVRRMARQRRHLHSISFLH